MISLRQCILSVISAAFISGIIKLFLQDPVAKEWLKFLCGIYLAIVLLNGIGNIDYSAILSPEISYTDQAERYMQEGKESAANSMGEIIKNNCQAYVMEKAAQMEADVTVEIILTQDDIPVPEKAIISGTISPYAKGKLSSVLTQDLGIAKEEQLWIG